MRWSSAFAIASVLAYNAYTPPKTASQFSAEQVAFIKDVVSGQGHQRVTVLSTLEARLMDNTNAKRPLRYCGRRPFVCELADYTMSNLECELLRKSADETELMESFLHELGIVPTSTKRETAMLILEKRHPEMSKKEKARKVQAHVDNFAKRAQGYSDQAVFSFIGSFGEHFEGPVHFDRSVTLSSMSEVRLPPHCRCETKGKNIVRLMSDWRDHVEIFELKEGVLHGQYFEADADTQTCGCFRDGKLESPWFHYRLEDESYRPLDVEEVVRDAESLAERARVRLKFGSPRCGYSLQ